MELRLTETGSCVTQEIKTGTEHAVSHKSSIRRPDSLIRAPTHQETNETPKDPIS